MRKNIIMILITILIFIILILGIRFYITKSQDNKIENDLIPIDNLNNNDIDNVAQQEEVFENTKIGTLTIPKINLYNIDICESVELETLSKSIGHFENTNLYDGNVGIASHNAGTKANLPLSFETSSSWTGQYETYKKCIKLVQYCLCCNGYGDSINLSNVQWNTSLSNVVKSFQADLNIEQTGTMNVDTWMALLLSKGNPDRSCTACDTRFEMTQERLDYLKSNGYTVVGRYLTGSSKGLKDDEPKRILDSGLSFFPIFQETLYTDTVSKYNYNLGVSDANKAVNRAKELGIPSGAIIYFAIDFDPIDSEISSYVIPYFNGINSAIGQYKVGIYGTRNACTKVMGARYAETCFVSDMSTGYSGNMGFKIPNNWNLDQFHEYSVTTASGSWDIDKVSYSGSFPVVTGLTYYKLGNFVLTGSHDGLEFPPYTGAKRLRYTISWTSEEPMNSLYVCFNKRSYYSDGTYSWTNESTLYLDYSNEYQRTITSNWIDVSDKIGYRFSYKCMDKSKPIGDPPSIGEELNREFEDGTCNVSVYIELEY